MTRWEVTIQYKKKNEEQKTLQATAHAEAPTGHEAIMASIEALKEQIPTAQVVKVAVNTRAS